MFEKGSPVRFIVIFLSLFALFYFFNVFFFGITSPGNHYSQFLDTHLNYIKWLRYALLNTTAWLLNHLGYTAITNDTDILIVGHGALKLIYSCLGFGIISFFSAFVISYPQKIKPKLLFLISGVFIIEILNIIRFLALAIFWDKKAGTQIIDHHTVFNVIIYFLIAFALYFWIKVPKPSKS